MESLPAYGKTADHRRAKTPDGALNRAVWHVLMALIGALSVSMFVGPEIARGQSTGSPCLAAPTLAMAGTRIVNVASAAQLQSAMGNLQTGDTIVLANGTYNLSSILYVNGRDIEFRFSTTGAEARNNLGDAPIGLRDGATFTQSGNLLTATASLFVNPSAGDLHLKSTATAVIDQVPALSSVTNDIDGNTRPLGVGYDIGADEFVGGGGDITPPSAPTGLTVTPIAAFERIHEMKTPERKM